MDNLIQKSLSNIAKTVQQRFGQANDALGNFYKGFAITPQKIESFGQSAWNNLPTRQFDNSMRNFNGFSQLVSPLSISGKPTLQGPVERFIAQPIAQTLDTGIRSGYAAYKDLTGINKALELQKNTINKAISNGYKITPIQQQQFKQAQSLYQPAKPMDYLNMGAITSIPKLGANITGGSIGMVMKAIDNVSNKKPITQDLGKAYDEGFQFSAKLGHLDKLIDTTGNILIKPLTQKFPVIQKVINKLTPEKIVNFKTWLSSSLKAANKSGTSMAIFGALEDTKNGDERLKNMWEQYKIGALFGGGTHALFGSIPAISRQIKEMKKPLTIEDPVVRLKYNEGIKRIETGDLRGAKDVYNSILNEPILSNEHYKAATDLSNRIKSQSSTPQGGVPQMMTPVVTGKARLKVKMKPVEGVPEMKAPKMNLEQLNKAGGLPPEGLPAQPQQKKPNIFQERLNAIKQGQGTLDATTQDPFVNSLVNQFKTKGSKTFSADKIPQVEYFVKRLGKERINQIYKEVGGATNEKGWIDSFWKTVKSESPNWEKEWKMANESLIQPSTPQGVSTIKIKPKVKMKVKKPIMQDIEEFGTIHPSKDTVTGPQAEVAYKNLKAHADSLTDRITNGIKHYKITQEQFSKYIENPLTAPPEIKPILDAHTRLMEISHLLRENPNLGKLQNYFPHMTEKSINLPPGIKNIGNDLWISDFNVNIGSSKRRMGTMTDFSTNYNKVMKNYFEQVAYEKYGKRVGFTPKVAEFVKKVETHLTPDSNGMYQQPSDAFDYVNESRLKQEITHKTPIFSKMEPFDTFDSLKRKFANEKNGGALAKTMEQVRDMRDEIGGMELKLEKMNIKEQIDYLASKLTYNKGKLKDILLQSTKNGTEPLQQSRIIALLRAEKNFRLQNLIDEVGKYEFGKETQSYLNTEIDRLMKSGKYESTLLDKAVNLVTGTLYRAQIWLNLNTGLAQKGESLRIPVLYSPDVITQGAKQRIIDMQSGQDILKRYDFSGVETDISKHLLQKNKETALSKVGEGLSKVGNVFVNIGENSKNRDFLYSAEAQGKSMGLEGKELYTFVRNELFANGFILHEFNTPQMLKNPLVRLLLQYQQYNIKLFNRTLEMAGGGEKGKAFGMVGSQVASAVMLALITGKGIETVTDKLFGIPIGPGLSIPIQIATLMKEMYDAKKEEEESGKSSTYLTGKNTKKITDLLLRNSIPAGNQFYKTKGAYDVLKQGYDTDPKGNVTYMAPTSNLDKTRGLLFGKTSFGTNKDYYGTGQKPFGGKQTELFKQQGATQGAYDKVMEVRKQTKIDNNMREQVRNSGKTVNTQDYFYYLDSKSGDVRRVNINFQPTPPQLTGNTELDKKLISKYKGELTTKANDAIKLFEVGKLSAQEANKIVSEVKAIQTNITPKKLKAAPRVKRFAVKKAKTSIAKFKVKAPKLTKIKIIKPKKFKLSKSPKLSKVKALVK